MYSIFIYILQYSNYTGLQGKKMLYFSWLLLSVAGKIGKFSQMGSWFQVNIQQEAPQTTTMS